MSHGRKIAVIGLGYVGLPVAAAFARLGYPVVGFDIDATRVQELRAGQDRTREVETSDLKLPALRFTDDSAAFRTADFFIVTVPTPIDGARRPDLSAMLEASRQVGAALKKGDIVVYEFDGLSGCRRRGMRTGSGALLRAQGRLGFQRRVFAGADQSGRQEASFRDDHQGGLGPERRKPRHRGRGLWIGCHRRHPPCAFDQGGRGREGDREYPTRSQHRLHERAVG